MTDIVVCSDLHLEFGGFQITNPQKADVLILSGDIIVADKISATEVQNADRYIYTQRFKEFFAQASAEFKHIIYVAGNHEFYHGKWKKSLSDIEEFLLEYPNVHFLEQECVEIEGIIYMGGTAWTDMNKGDPLTLHATRDAMNDFALVRNDEFGYRKLSPMDTAIRHKKTLNFFKDTAEKYADKKIVMVMHHAPHQKSIHENYVSDRILNGAYASDLSEFILDHPQIKLVTHGHMHNSSDYYIGDTRVICNPRGYHPNDLNDQFFPYLTVEV